jgi:hypothetical protein
MWVAGTLEPAPQITEPDSYLTLSGIPVVKVDCTTNCQSCPGGFAKVLLSHGPAASGVPEAFDKLLAPLFTGQTFFFFPTKALFLSAVAPGFGPLPSLHTEGSIQGRGDIRNVRYSRPLVQEGIEHTIFRSERHLLPNVHKRTALEGSSRQDAYEPVKSLFEKVNPFSVAYDGCRVRIDPGAVSYKMVSHEIAAHGFDEHIVIRFARTFKTSLPAIDLETIPTVFSGLTALELPCTWSMTDLSTPYPGNRDGLIRLLK